MITWRDAQQRVLAAVRSGPTELVPLTQAVHRYLAESITAPLDLPPFDNSAMDGYAVRSEDLRGVSPGNPLRLPVRGTIAAGSETPAPLKPGFCDRIYTGSSLPPGADTVVMQEEAELIGAGTVIFRIPVQPWENVRFRGEDVRQGQQLLQPGRRLSPGSIALLGALGQSSVRVGSRPTLGLLATGTELHEPGTPLGPGQIYESNRAALAALFGRAGAQTRIFPLVRDTLEETRTALEQALTDCDAVITTGGVSVGDLDFVKEAFTQIGGQLEFWKVSIRPGKPFVFGRWRDKLLFGLPGNPVSALVTGFLLVSPAVIRFQGARAEELSSLPAVLGESVSNPGDRPHFIRVRVDEDGTVRSAGVQASHILSSVAEAVGLLEIPPQTTWETGRAVKFFPWS